MDSTEATRTYLRSIMPTKAMVDHFVAAQDAETEIPVDLGGTMCNNAKSTYDPEIGWVVCDGFRGGSVDGSRGFYAYEADGARRVVNSVEKQSRVHAYGNSFTHCDQVSDGETWQEYLAAHLQEPIRNYGIGGHSVYQAYRRMRVVEPEHPAEYVILNVWDDDHFRNLDAWRAVRMNRVPRWTLPHLSVNVEAETFEENENPCLAREDHYKQCDPDWIWERFSDDPTVRASAARQAGVKPTDHLAAWVADGFGFSEDAFSDLDPAVRIEKMHREAALFATRCVIEMAEQFAEVNGRKLMVLLSFGAKQIKDALQNEPLFDQTLLGWLKGRETSVVDLRDPFRQDFARSSLDADTYLKPFYNGHHTPRGNFFFAWGIKERVVAWLDPKPGPYSEQGR